MRTAARFLLVAIIATQAPWSRAQGDDIGVMTQRSVYRGWGEHTTALAPHAPDRFLAVNPAAFGVIDTTSGRAWHFEPPWKHLIDGFTLERIDDKRYLVVNGESFHVIEVDTAAASNLRAREGPAGGVFDRRPLKLAEMRSLALNRSDHTVERLASGEFMIIGGNSSGEATAATEFIDIATLSTRAGPPMGVPRSRHASLRLRDGRILVVGGKGVGAETSELYDPTSGRWREAGRLTRARAISPRSRIHLVEMTDGRVLALGGDATAHISAELWHANSNAWISAPPPLFARENPQALALHGGRVLLVGGSMQTKATEIFNAVANQWSLGPETAAAWSGNAPWEIEPFLWVGQGRLAQLKHRRQFVGSFNFYTEGIVDFDAPLVTARLALPRWRHATARLADGRVLLTGGLTRTAASGPASVVRAAEVYDPRTGVSAPTAAPALGRFDHRTLPLPDGRVAVLGGEVKEHDYREPPEQLPIELWDPATGQWQDAANTSLQRGDRVVPVTGGRVLVFRTEMLPPGGLARVTKIYEWKPREGELAVVGGLANARTAFALTRLGADDILISGGQEATELIELDRDCATPCAPEYVSLGGYRDAAQDLIWNASSNALRPAGAPRPQGDTLNIHDYPAARIERTAPALARLPDGKALLYEGGEGGGLWLYESGRGGWRLAAAPRAASPEPNEHRREGREARLADGRLVVLQADGRYALIDHASGRPGAALPGLRIKRFHFAATLLGENEILITGGVTIAHGGNDSLPIAEIESARIESPSAASIDPATIPAR